MMTNGAERIEPTAPSSSSSSRSMSEELQELSSRCQSMKRLREHVPSLPSMRNARGLQGRPRKKALSAQNLYKVGSKGVGGGIVGNDGISGLHFEAYQPTSVDHLLSVESTTTNDPTTNKNAECEYK